MCVQALATQIVLLFCVYACAPVSAHVPISARAPILECAPTYSRALFLCLCVPVFLRLCVFLRVQETDFG